MAFPYALEGRGVTATCASVEQHVAQLIEQLLLTRPGERVNRPTLGCGLGDLVFGPSSPEVAAAIQVTVATAVAEFLGDLVRVTEIQVTSLESTLRVDLGYELLAEGAAGSGTTAATASISVPVPA